MVMLYFPLGLNLLLGNNYIYLGTIELLSEVIWI